MFRDYARALGELAGASVTLRPFDSLSSGRAKSVAVNWHCGLLKQPACSCRCCAGILDGLRDVSVAKPCACGPVVPVRSGRELVAMLQFSPVPHPTAGSNSRRWKAGVTLLRLLADSLSRLSNQLLIQRRNTEPELIQQTKEFILKNVGTDLSLGLLARQLRTSPFHLSKLFRKSTGLTLTEFIARARVERVKAELLRPNARVSEVAFQCGFQSLTQFNRVFLKLSGQSPTGYRRELRKD